MSAPAPDPRIQAEARRIIAARGIADPAERAQAEREMELILLTVTIDAARGALRDELVPTGASTPSGTPSQPLGDKVITGPWPAPDAGGKDQD